MLWLCLNDSLSFFKNNFLAIAVIILPIAIPVEIFNAVYQNYYVSDEFSFVEQIPTLAVMLVAYPIYAVSVIFYMVSKIDGKPMAIKTAWAWGLRFWGPYLLLIILVTVLVVLGLMAFIIPGIYFAVRFAFSEFELLLNNATPMAALKQSWAGTQSVVWEVFIGYVILGVCIFIPVIFLGNLLDEEGRVFQLLDLGVDAILPVFESLFTIFAYRVYVQLKDKRAET